MGALISLFVRPYLSDQNKTFEHKTLKQVLLEANIKMRSE